jgi:hypothetical protein
MLDRLSPRSTSELTHHCRGSSIINQLRRMTQVSSFAAVLAAASAPRRFTEFNEASAPACVRPRRRLIWHHGNDIKAASEAVIFSF